MQFLHRAVDDVVAYLSSRSKMFYDGWGDPDLIERLVRHARRLGPPADIDVKWMSARRRLDGGHLFEGWFTSPDRLIPLPAEARAAYFQLMLPPDPFVPPRPAVCVHLAGTGDPTYVGRRLLTRKLLERNIGALILENPFYGHRKPKWQEFTRLRRVTDQLMMNLATVQEARALLKWLRAEGFERVGVSGYSMGGYMAGFSAQTVPFPVAAIPCAAGDSAIEPLVNSPLRDICDWETLAEEVGGRDRADMMMQQTLSALALSEHGTPVAPEAAIIVGARQDKFVTPQEPHALHRHWHGSELRWIEGGHTTGWILHGAKVREAIVDAFERLAALS